MTNANPGRGLKKLALWQLLITFVGVGACWAGTDAARAASFATGAALMLANAAALAWAWWRVVTQKRIAWTALIIVIKYAVLLSTIFYLTRQSWFHVTLAGLGIASFLLAALLWAVTNSEDLKERRDALG